MAQKVTHIGFLNKFRKYHPNVPYNDARTECNNKWMELRTANACNSSKYDHKIPCKQWPDQFHIDALQTITDWEHAYNTQQAQRSALLVARVGAEQNEEARPCVMELVDPFDMKSWLGQSLTVQDLSLFDDHPNQRAEHVAIEQRNQRKQQPQQVRQRLEDIEFDSESSQDDEPLIDERALHEAKLQQFDKRLASSTNTMKKKKAKQDKQQKMKQKAKKKPKAKKNQKKKQQQ